MRGGLRRCFDDVQPDLIVSVHPLTQAIPLHILANKGEGGKGPFNNILPFPSLPSLPGRGGGGGERYSKGGGRKVPFATVVTDWAARIPSGLTSAPTRALCHRTRCDASRSAAG